MGSRRRDGNYSCQKNNKDTHSLTTTKLRNTAMPRKIPSMKKSCKKSLRISWKRY
jgi:hypothetical protein